MVEPGGVWPCGERQARNIGCRHRARTRTVSLGLLATQVGQYYEGWLHKVQFQADGFNIMNHVNLRNPNANRTDVNFSTISSSGPARNIQFALKYNF